MDLETRQAYSEVNKFLELIGEDLANKVPLKLRNFFKREMDKSYIPTLNANIPIKYQKLKRKTIVIITSLNLKYWCKDENKKNELIEMYYNNEKKYQEELREKYNTDNLFKSDIKKESSRVVENEVAFVEYKESILKKIVNKIKSIFIKK